MAMRKSTRRELRKLRELTALLLAGRRCCFCRLPLVELPDGFEPGSGECPPFEVSVTVHHRDGDHGNNDIRNHRLCHRSCHRRHHAKIRQAAAPGKFK